jgi:hypothetical protein
MDGREGRREKEDSNVGRKSGREGKDEEEREGVSGSKA